MRVNMDSSIANDPRFKIMAANLGVTHNEVIGGCFKLWLACYERRRQKFSKVEANVAAEIPSFVEAMIEVGLATDQNEKNAIIHGVKKRIKFLKDQAKKGSKGGKKSGESRRSNARDAQSKQKADASANASGSAAAYTLTLTPDQSPDQVSDPPSEDPLTSTRARVCTPEKASKPKVIRWTGEKVRSDSETRQWATRRFGDFAPDFIELCSRLADSRKDGVAQTVLERFTRQLIELAEENAVAFRYGVVQILELDSDFEYSGRPSKIVNYVKTCMKSYRPNGTSANSRGRAQSGAGLSAADIRALADRAREVDGK